MKTRALAATLLSLIAFRADADFHTDLDALAHRVMGELQGPPGMSIAVVRDGEVIHQQGYGFADLERGDRVTAETRFYIASSTKPFTAAAARLLAEEGKLDLDAPLKKTLPGLEFTGPLSAERVSLRDFLAHRAGITSGAVNFRVSNAGSMTDDDIYASFRLRTDSAPVGFRYSNVAYILAALALEEATGTTWQEVLRARIFAPLGMTRTGTTMSGAPVAASYSVDTDGPRRTLSKVDATMHAAGGMVSTAPDLARFVVAQMNDGRVGGKQIFPARAIRELRAPQVHLSASWGPLKRYAYGLGWYLADYEGDTVVHHFGGYGGAYAHISWMPDHRIGVVVLSNGGRDPAELLAWYTYDALLQKKDLQSKYDGRIATTKEELTRSRAERAGKRKALEERLKNPPALAHPLASYAGTYRSERLGDVVVSVRGTALIASTGVLSTTLVPDGGDAFRLDWSGETDLEPVTFVFEGSKAKTFDWDGRPFQRLD